MTASGTLCIVGVDLVGGSLAASVKAKGLPWRVRAADRRRSALDYALQRGFVDEAADSVEEGVRGADLVVLAGSVGTIRRTLETLGSSLRGGQVVTDVGETKGTIVADARRFLPPGVPFVGAHPVVAAEQRGLENAAPGLFEGRWCVLIPDPESPPAAVEAVSDLWHRVGAQVLRLEVAEHDRLFALLSHLPRVIACAAVGAVSAELTVRDLELAGAGLVDLVRLAKSSPGLWRELCLENREPLVAAVDRFAERLGELRRALAEGDEAALTGLFEAAAQIRGIPWAP